MKITITTESTNPLITTTHINDGKNTLTITKAKLGHESDIVLQSNGDSIYPIMDLLKILEDVN